MRISKLRLFIVLVFQCSVFFPLQTSLRGEEVAWEEDPVFEDLKTELEEVAAMLDLCQAFLDLQKRHPEAEATLSNLRNMIQGQVFRSQRDLPIPVPGNPEGLVAQPVLPSVLTSSEEVSKLPAKLRAGFKARKNAYAGLIQATDPIAGLGLISACLLHRM